MSTGDENWPAMDYSIPSVIYWAVIYPLSRFMLWKPGLKLRQLWATRVAKPFYLTCKNEITIIKIGHFRTYNWNQRAMDHLRQLPSLACGSVPRMWNGQLYIASFWTQNINAPIIYGAPFSCNQLYAVLYYDYVKIANLVRRWTCRAPILCLFFFLLFFSFRFQFIFHLFQVFIPRCKFFISVRKSTTLVEFASSFCPPWVRKNQEKHTF